MIENNTENLFDVLDKEDKEQEIEFNSFINNKQKLINFDNENDLSNNDDPMSKLTNNNKNEKQIIYKCDKCPRICKRKGDFQKHVRTHTGEKPFKCNSCDKCYATQTSLKLHERGVHCGERPYKCDYCDKTFTNLTNYKNHVRIHTGEKPYKCNLCERAFTEHSTLYKHQLTHSKEKKYVCNICGNSYRQVSSLRSHSRTVHSINTTNTNYLNYNDITNNLKISNECLFLSSPSYQQEEEEENQKSINTASKTNCYLIKLNDKPAINIVEVLNDKSIKKIKIINKKPINLNNNNSYNIIDNDKLQICSSDFMRDNDKFVSNINNLHNNSDDYMQEYGDDDDDDDEVIDDFNENDDTAQSYSINFNNESESNNDDDNEENKNSQTLLSSSTQSLSQLLVIPSNDFLFTQFI